MFDFAVSGDKTDCKVDGTHQVGLAVTVDRDKRGDFSEADRCRVYVAEAVDFHFL